MQNIFCISCNFCNLDKEIENITVENNQRTSANKLLLPGRSDARPDFIKCKTNFAMKEPRNPRAELTARIQAAHKAQTMGAEGTINQLILNQYREEGFGTIFKTISGWNQAGYMIERGQRGLPLWSAPRARKPGENGKSRPDFFSVIYVFSEKQVFPLAAPRPQKRHTAPAETVQEPPQERTIKVF